MSGTERANSDETTNNTAITEDTTVESVSKSDEGTAATENYRRRNSESDLKRTATTQRSAKSEGSSGAKRPTMKGMKMRSQPVLTKRQKEVQNYRKGVLARNSVDESPVSAALYENRRRRRQQQCGNGVRFGTVEIREYALMAGDNPGGYRGCPLTMQWDHHNKLSLGLDEYEEERPPRRNGSQMNIPWQTREQMLRDSGYTRGEIQAATKSVNIARRQRKRTEEMLQITKIQEFAERLSRGTRNAVFRGKKEKERKYIKNAWSIHHQLENLPSIDQDDLVQGCSLSNSDSMSFEMSGSVLQVPPMNSPGQEPPAIDVPTLKEEEQVPESNPQQEEFLC